MRRIPRCPLREWTDGEIMKNPAICRELPIRDTDRVQPLGNVFTRLGIQTLAQRQEFLFADGSLEPELLRADAQPLTGDLLAFRVVVTHAQVLAKVLPCVLQIQLWLWSQHHTLPYMGRFPREFFVPRLRVVKSVKASPRHAALPEVQAISSLNRGAAHPSESRRTTSAAPAKGPSI